MFKVRSTYKRMTYEVYDTLGKGNNLKRFSKVPRGRGPGASREKWVILLNLVGLNP